MKSSIEVWHGVKRVSSGGVFSQLYLFQNLRGAVLLCFTRRQPPREFRQENIIYYHLYALSRNASRRR